MRRLLLFRIGSVIAYFFPFVLLFRRSIGLHDVQLSELSIRQDMQDLKTTNGVMVWKISDFSRRLREAETGKTASLYSPLFYTSPAGYKVCARLYPNGDGIGKGTHLSLFFVVMKGDFDALLPCPFRQKVSLMLLDQSTTNPRHVVETFRPDLRSSSFQRSQQEMNVASGCPLFHPLSALNHTSYLQDDTIFLKIVVHQNGLQGPHEVWTCTFICTQLLQVLSLSHFLSLARPRSTTCNFILLETGAPLQWHTGPRSSVNSCGGKLSTVSQLRLRYLSKFCSFFNTFT